MGRTKATLTALAAAACLGLLSTARAAEPSLEALVRDLGSADLSRRNRARLALIERGREAYEALHAFRPDGNAERSHGVRLLLFHLEPLHGPWHRALEAGRFYYDRGRYAEALPLLLRAARKHEPLRGDKWLHHLARTSFERLDARERSSLRFEDWGLFATGQYERLVLECPASPLRTRCLFKLGRFADVVRENPEHELAAYASYSLVSGHAYFEPPAYLEVTDPDREIEAWPRFLAEHPGHPGQDDAAYRLGRAYEVKGDHVRAVRFLHLSTTLPDGEYLRKGLDRVRYVMDALAGLDELAELARRPPAPFLRSWALLTRAVRLERLGRFEEALAAYQAFVTACPDSPFRDHARSKIDDLHRVLVPRLRGASTGTGADRCLYELGRHYYRRLLGLYNPLWEGRRAEYLSFEVNSLGRSHAFRHPDYFASHNHFLAAARFFRALVEDHPDSPLFDRALYSLGTCWLRAPALNHFAVFPLERSEMLDRARACYLRLLRDCPRSPLRPDAARMVAVIDALPADWMQY